MVADRRAGKYVRELRKADVALRVAIHDEETADVA